MATKKAVERKRGPAPKGYRKLDRQAIERMELEPGAEWSGLLKATTMRTYRGKQLPSRVLRSHEGGLFYIPNHAVLTSYGIFDLDEHTDVTMRYIGETTSTKNGKAMHDWEVYVKEGEGEEAPF